MVVLTEMTSVFWGVILEGGKKKYTQTTEKPVHISMAALDPTKPCGDGPVSVMIEHNSGSYVLCSLLKDKLYQQPLNLEFAAGEEISFIVHGTGSVHLSGFVMPEDDFNQYGDMSGDEDLSEEDMESEDEEDESDEEDEAVVRPGKKRQIVDTKRASKKAKITLADMEDDDDEDDSDDDDFIVDEAEEASDDEDDDEEEEEEEEEEESDIEESPKPVGKKNGKAAVVDAKTNSTTPTSKDKAQNASAGKAKTATTPNAKSTDKTQNTPKQQAPAAAAAAQPKEDGDSQGKKKKKKNKKKNKKNKAENQQQTPESPAPSTSTAPAPASKVPAKRVAEGGVVIEDVKQGHGPEAQLGKKVAVYYTGRLMNGKVFDCCTSGNGFKFKLGKKEVISGWDVGVKGMKVGGKRTLVIPPKMGYGSSAAGPIPANSTLVFDVELKSVN